MILGSSLNLQACQKVKLELGSWEQCPSHMARKLQQWPHCSLPGQSYLTHQDIQYLYHWCWAGTRTMWPLWAKATATSLQETLFPWSPFLHEYTLNSACLAGYLIGRACFTCLHQSHEKSWDNEFLRELGIREILEMCVQKLGSDYKAH